jgi:hypothetical protein
MECQPHQISFNEITSIETDEQNISQILDLNSELTLLKTNSLEEFLGIEDESTEISFLLNSMDNDTRQVDETESVSEILNILKKCPNSATHKRVIFNEYINPFGGNICRPVGVKKVSLKVLSNVPERVSRPVLNRTSLPLI